MMHHTRRHMSDTRVPTESIYAHMAITEWRHLLLIQNYNVHVQWECTHLLWLKLHSLWHDTIQHMLYKRLHQRQNWISSKESAAEDQHWNTTSLRWAKSQPKLSYHDPHYSFFTFFLCSNTTVSCHTKLTVFYLPAQLISNEMLNENRIIHRL